jgi:molybdopterin converting factor small subunit
MSKEEYREIVIELEELRIAINEKDEELRRLKTQEKNLKKEERKLKSSEIRLYDRDRTPISIGDTVLFFTKGLFNTKEGVVYKLADNRSRVTSKDKKGNSISRAPYNLRVVKKRTDHVE